MGDLRHSFLIGPARFGTAVLGRLADGSIAGAATTFAAAATRQPVGTHLDSAGIFLFDHLGRHGRQLGRSIAAREYFTPESNRGIGTFRAFGLSAAVAIRGDAVLVGTADSYEITVLGTDGRVRQLIRRSAASRKPITAADRREYARREIAQFRDADHARVMAETYTDMDYPATMPAFGEFRVDGDGNLWIQDYPWPPDVEEQWQVFNPDGYGLGSVDVPQGLALLTIDRDMVIGRWEDASGVEHVRGHVLRKPTIETQAAGFEVAGKPRQVVP
jgi:hypothetical protein